MLQRRAGLAAIVMVLVLAGVVADAALLTLTGNADQAWLVNFFDGCVDYQVNGDLAHTRPVRGSS